ncbi:MAG: FkbM family methyltransferase [Gammaproteobacteria bacterium]
MTAPYVFDVGANTGQFGLELAIRNPSANVHLFEPIPELCTIMEEEIKRLKLENVTIHQYGIASNSGIAKLNISKLGDWGVSSTHQFNDENIFGNRYWQIRKDLSYSEQIEIEVKRLDEVILEHNIEKIDFIKIDTQGMDIDVLISLGNQIDKLEAGFLECPATKFTSLYQNETDLLYALQFLADKGLKALYIKPNDESCNEVNVFFAKSPEKWNNLKTTLSLSGNEIFSGKDFWSYPSSTLETNSAIVRIKELSARTIALDKEVNRLNKEIERLNNFILEQKSDVLPN